MAADSGTRTLVRPRRRIASLDALRGLTLVSMIAYHACWDLVYLFHADWDWYRGTRRVHLAAEHLLDLYPPLRILLQPGAAAPPEGTTVFGCRLGGDAGDGALHAGGADLVRRADADRLLHVADGPTGKTAAARTCGGGPRRQRRPCSPCCGT